MKYDAFISYNQTADGILADALQSALHKLTKPFYKLRALRVFRDTTGLDPGGNLWSRIVDALDQSEHLLLMASPDAANGKYTNAEIKHWLETRSTDNVLIIWTSGVIHWDDTIRDFDWNKTTSLPKMLRGTFNEVPLWVDLRWATVAPEQELSLRNPEFKKSVAALSASIQGKEPEEIYSEDRIQHRRTKWVIGIAIALIFSGILFGMWRWIEEKEARVREAIASAEVSLRSGRELALSGRPSEGITTVSKSLLIVDGEESVEPRMRQAISWWKTEEGVEFKTDASVLTATVGNEGVVSILEESGKHQLFSSDGSKLGNGITLKRFPEQPILGEYSPHLDKIAVADEEGYIHIWSLPEGLPTKPPLMIHSIRGIYALKFDHSGERIAVGCGKDVMIVDLKKLAISATLRPPHDVSRVNSVAFNPTGELIAIGLSAGEFWVMEIDNPKKSTRLPKPMSRRPIAAANTVAWAPQGNRILGSTSDRRTFLWQEDDNLGWRSQPPLVTEQPIEAAVFSPDGGTAFSADHVGGVAAWLISETGATKNKESDSDSSPPNLLRFGREINHGGERLRITSGLRGEILVYGGRRPATLWRLFGASTAPSPIAPPATPLFSAEIMPQFDGAVLGSRDGRLRCFRLAGWDDPLWARDVAPRKTLVVASARQKSSAMVAAGTSDGPIFFYDPKTGTPIHFNVAPGDGILGLELGNVSGRAHTIFWQIEPLGDEKINLFDLENGRTATMLDVGDSAPLVARISSSGKYIALGMSDGSIQLFCANTEKSEAFAVVSPRQAAVYDLTFHPEDDQVFCSGHADGRLHQWRIDGIDAKICPVAGNAGSMVRTLSYSPDGTVIVAGTSRGTVTAWSAFDLRQLSSTYYVATSPDLSETGPAVLAVSVSEEHIITAIDVEGRLFRSIGGSDLSRSRP